VAKQKDALMNSAAGKTKQQFEKKRKKNSSEFNHPLHFEFGSVENMEMKAPSPVH
jgi:hypothetical protein